MAKATFDQFLQIGDMISKGAFDRETVQAIIEKRFEVKKISVPREHSLLENEYLVHVAYDMPRDKAKLESEFSENGVSDLFYGNYEWQPHLSCAEIDQTPGNRVMLLKRFNRKIMSEDAIDEMKRIYRPATHLEAYAFAKANPELQRQFWIVALGSSALCDGGRDVALLCSYSDGRFLDCDVFDSEWGPDDRFLFVRLP